ncbi:helix-hairpin-helix domain-containing protein [Planctomicrobium sp. SH661]|uniref:helix-hairpin-helix domain-containing protein n=1 Tax=Planctomicrobium sp. SH661 TaxID=3448124 RepID=UPI003F5B8189
MPYFATRRIKVGNRLFQAGDLLDESIRPGQLSSMLRLGQAVAGSMEPTAPSGSAPPQVGPSGDQTPSIEVLGLRKQVTKALLDASIRTLEDLEKIPVPDLVKIKGIGDAAAKEIETAFNDFLDASESSGTSNKAPTSEADGT